MRRFALAASALVLLASTTLGDTLPKRNITPGVALTKVPAESAKCLSDLMGEHVPSNAPITLTMICTPGYAKCIRNVSTGTKEEVYKAYGLPGEHAGYCNTEQGCEVDHLISIEIGGANDQKNLWPQPYQGETFNAHVKDRLENYFHAEACAGRIGLQEAQKEISENWIDAYKKYLKDP
jgi:hypothetical protein